MSDLRKLDRREFLSLTGRVGGLFVLGTSLTACAADIATKELTKAKLPAEGVDLGVFVNINPKAMSILSVIVPKWGRVF